MKYRYVTNMYKGFKETCIRLFNNLRADAIPTRTGAFEFFQYGNYFSFVNWAKKNRVCYSLFNVGYWVTFARWYISGKCGSYVYIKLVELIGNNLSIINIFIFNMKCFIYVSIFLFVYDTSYYFPWFYDVTFIFTEKIVVIILLGFSAYFLKIFFISIVLESKMHGWMPLRFYP